MKCFRKSFSIRETAAYVASSLLATALDYAIYLAVLYVLHHSQTDVDWSIPFFGLCTLKLNDLNIAYTAARLVSSVENFFFNNYVVFKQPSDGHVAVRLIKYMLVAVVVAAAGNVVLTLFHEGCHIPALVAKVMTDTSTFILSYFAQKLFVFRTRSATSENEDIHR